MASATPDSPDRPKLMVNDILTDSPADRTFRNILYGLIPFEFKKNIQDKFIERLRDEGWREEVQNEVNDKLIKGFDRWKPEWRAFLTVLLRQAATVMVYIIRDYQQDRIPELLNISLTDVEQLKEVRQRWRYVKDFNYRLAPELQTAPEIPEEEGRKAKATLAMLFKLGKTFGMPGELACLAPLTSLDLIVKTFEASFPDGQEIRMPHDLRQVIRDYHDIPKSWLYYCDHIEARLSAFFFVWEELAANAGRLRYWLNSLSEHVDEDKTLTMQGYELFQGSLTATNDSAVILVKGIKKVQDHLDKHHVDYLQAVQGKSV